MISSFFRIRPVLLLAGALSVFSCADNPSGSAPESPASADTAKRVFDPKEREREMLEKSRTDEKSRLSSPLRYAESDKNTDIWGVLLRLSKYAKEVHNGNYTVLVPTNEALKNRGLDLVLELKRPENRDLLNRVMANHILKTPINVLKMQEVKEVETIDGRTYPVEWGQHLIGDAHYADTQVETDHGTAVWMIEVLDFPEKELRQSLEKNQRTQK